MTEEEYFRKHYHDSCYGERPLSPYWDFFQDGVEFGERQSEKKIEELEKGNAELKELINLFVQWNYGCCKTPDFKDLVKQAEQLLKECK